MFEYISEYTRVISYLVITGTQNIYLIPSYSFTNQQWPWIGYILNPFQGLKRRGKSRNYSVRKVLR
jgi:hypothetical protein